MSLSRRYCRPGHERARFARFERPVGHKRNLADGHVPRPPKRSHAPRSAIQAFPPKLTKSSRSSRSAQVLMSSRARSACSASRRNIAESPRRCPVRGVACNRSIARSPMGRACAARSRSPRRDLTVALACRELFAQCCRINSSEIHEVLIERAIVMVLATLPAISARPLSSMRGSKHVTAQPLSRTARWTLRQVGNGECDCCFSVIDSFLFRLRLSNCCSLGEAEPTPDCSADRRSPFFGAPPTSCSLQFATVEKE